MNILGVDRVNFYEILGRIRPAQLGVLAKKCLFIKRIWTQTTDGHWFWIDPVSVFGLTILKDGVYEPRLSEIVKILLRPGDNFLDIGGNEGYFSILGATEVEPTGKVYCIEPQTRLRPVIEQNLTRNSAKSVDYHQLALNDGDEPTVRLYLRPDSNSGASSMFRHWKLGNRYETVPCSSLDAFCTKKSMEHLRLIKIDCEGAEHHVIKGSQQLLQQKKTDFISLEYHVSITGLEPCETTHKILNQAGYILTIGPSFAIYHLPGLEHNLAHLGVLKVNCSLADHLGNDEILA